MAGNPNPVRVLVVGDSFVWGHGLLDEQRRYPELLEIELNNRAGKAAFEVSSIASFGGSTIEESEWITKSLLRKYKPDIVILGYVLNDIIPSGKELSLCESNVELCVKGLRPSKDYLQCLRGEEGFVNKLINSTLTNNFPNLSKNLMVKRCTPDWAKDLDENSIIDYPESSPYWLEFNEAVAVIKQTVGEIPIIWAPTNHRNDDKPLMVIKEFFKKNNYIIAPMRKGKDTIENYLRENPVTESSAGGLNLTKAHASPVDSHPGSALNTAYSKDLADIIMQYLPKASSDKLMNGRYELPSQLVISTNPASMNYEKLNSKQEILSYSDTDKDKDYPRYKTITEQYLPQYVPCLRVGSPYLQINFDQKIPVGSKFEIQNISKTSNLRIQEFGYGLNGEEVYGAVKEFKDLIAMERTSSVNGFLLIDTKNSCDLRKEIDFPNIKIKVSKKD